MSHTFTSRLSERHDWANHWKKHDLVRVIPATCSFHDLIKEAASILGNSGRAIELGGFPGSFCVFLKKYCGMETTLLDYFIDRKIIKLLFETNGLDLGDIEIIEDDAFSYVPLTRYDLVCSFGFIEHFTNLDEVFQNHLKFIAPGGVLLVTLPNFCGVNGLLQKVFDPGNLAIHNREIMNLTVLRKSLSKLGMQNIRVEYYPSTQVWLENLRNRTLFVRAIVRIINIFMKYFSKIVGAKSKALSNSIVILAHMPLK